MSAPTEASEVIQEHDPLGRFIYSSAHFSQENKRVKHNAFMPGTDGRTSVFRLAGLADTAAWDIGEEVGRQRNQTLYARGDIVAADAFKRKLTVVPAEPPPRHANLDAWPAEKSERKLIAIELAHAAKLVMKP